ncbi:hypothetical protein X943_000143 [Babesia divergens]|uniref:Uncharacterized protein n=1 Tax=Babesia divergens TaxID=32595 RepID=A0AAD9LEG5_BABDI|nr:hypothetical protein X943_000143 [Babesia divergens]
MKAATTLSILLAILMGWMNATADYVGRQTCISKCLQNNKGKFMRPMHRVMCKLYCTPRHGAKLTGDETNIHPSLNGRDAIYNM